MSEIINLITQLINNKIFISVFFAWFISNIVKVLIIFFTEKKTKFSDFYRSGGMPSTHTAGVTGLTVGVLLFEGVGTLFIVTLAFTIIVIHDAMGVRFQAEKHAKFLNEMIKKQKLDTPLFSEHIGHKVKEVVGGIIVGIVVPLAIYFL